MDIVTSANPPRQYTHLDAIRFEARRIAEMVDRLPAVIWDMNNSELIRQAALECFFVHVRTLIEFLGIRPQDARDRSARDTLANTGWTPTLDAALKARLDADWETISQHLVHFSGSRVLDETGNVVVPSTDLAALQRVADDVLAIWDQYATESNNLLVPHRADFGMLFDPNYADRFRVDSDESETPAPGESAPETKEPGLFGRVSSLLRRFSRWH
jgi:hypothetical protein